MCLCVREFLFVDELEQKSIWINIFSEIASSSAFPLYTESQPICNGCHSVYLQDKRFVFNMNYLPFGKMNWTLSRRSILLRGLLGIFRSIRAWTRARHPHFSLYTSHSTVTIYQFQNAVIACNWQITLKCHRVEWQKEKNGKQTGKKHQHISKV